MYDRQTDGELYIQHSEVLVAASSWELRDFLGFRACKYVFLAIYVNMVVVNNLHHGSFDMEIGFLLGICNAPL